ncbi:LOW QUALITY PROTEIN: polycystin-1-like protein 1 [Megaptera novaeangliae]
MLAKPLERFQEESEALTSDAGPEGTQRSPTAGSRRSGPFSELVEDSFPTCGPKDGGPETPSVIDPEIQRVAPGGPRGSQEESSAWAAQGQCDSEGQLRPHLSTVVRLPGCSRPAARAALTGRRASGWIDRSTRAVSVHFTLYSPPAQLFSSVSLSAETPTGALTPASLLESVTLLCRDSTPLCHLLLPEASSLGTWPTHGAQGPPASRGELTGHLAHSWSTGTSCFQRRAHWAPGPLMEHRDLLLPELAIVGVGLTCYVASGHLVTLAEEVTDFHKGLCQGFMDLSHRVSWNQIWQVFKATKQGPRNVMLSKGRPWLRLRYSLPF